MKILIAPDKFKGSLTSIEACNAIKKGIVETDAAIEVLLFPMADGGDGFAEVMKYYLHTETQFVQSVDPLGRSISSSYEWNREDHVAIIELASCSGLVILKNDERDPMVTSTFGTGLQIAHSINQGADKIILGLGGSATNDAGIGILAALGFTFLDGEDVMVQPIGENLLSIKKILIPAVLPTVKIEIACDVDNPMYGTEGAAYIFSPQKGATPGQVERLDDGLKHFSGIIQQYSGKDLSSIPGTGAAGGIAAGLMAFLEVNLTKGTALIIQASGIKDALDDAAIIITGEGKIDQQSFRGKTISAITSLAKEKNIPVAALCGKLELTSAEWKRLGLAFAAEINDASPGEEECMKNASGLLTGKTKSVVPLLLEIGKRDR